MKPASKRFKKETKFDSLTQNPNLYLQNYQSGNSLPQMVAADPFMMVASSYHPNSFDFEDKVASEDIIPVNKKERVNPGRMSPLQKNDHYDQQIWKHLTPKNEVLLS